MEIRYKNTVHQANSMDVGENLEGENLYEKYREDDKTDNERSIRSEKLIDIIIGNSFDNNDDRNLKVSLGLIYTLGEHQTPASLSYLDEKSDYFAKSTISKNNYLQKMERDNILNLEEEENEYKISLTELGKELFRSIRDIFNTLKDSKEVETAILQFRDQYLRNPSVKEVSNMLNRPVNEEEIHKTSLNWESEDYDEGQPEEIVFQIAIGHVICQTSAEDVLGIVGEQYLGEEIPVIGFSDTIQESYSRYIQETPDYNEYASTNENFLKSLDLYYNGSGVFRLVFDDFTKFVIDKKELKFKVEDSKEVKEMLINTAEESSF
jgi:hypothetical protein